MKVQHVDYEPQPVLFFLKRAEQHIWLSIGPLYTGMSGLSQHHHCDTETIPEDEPLAPHPTLLLCLKNSLFTSQAGRLTASYMWKYKKMDVQDSAYT